MSYSAQIEIFNRSHIKIGEVDYAASVQRSFALNAIGSARFVVSAKSPLWSAGILEVGNIVIVNSDAGISPWGGWITHFEQHNNSLLVTCKELAYIFSRRRLGKSEFFPYQNVGDLTKQLTAQTNPFVISSGSGPADNTPLSKEFHFTGGKAALRRLPLDTGVDWWIQVLPNGQGVLHTGNRGQDLTQGVVFSENNIVDDITYTRDGEAMINSVVFVGRGDGSWQRAPHVEAADHAAITQFGLYEATNVRYDIIHSSALNDVARRELLRNNRPLETLDFHVANIGGITGQFAEGDLCTVNLANYGPNGLNVPCRVVGRECDEYSTSPFRVLLQIM